MYPFAQLQRYKIINSKINLEVHRIIERPSSAGGLPRSIETFAIPRVQTKSEFNWHSFNLRSLLNSTEIEMSDSDFILLKRLSSVTFLLHPHHFHPFHP